MTLKLRDGPSSQIQFPDGDSVGVIWRERSPPKYRDAYRTTDFELLRHAAVEGDGVASILLHQMISACQRVPGSQVELSEAIDDLQQTHAISPRGNTGPTKSIRDADIPRVVAQMRSAYDACSELDAEQKSEPERWLKLAADNGSSVAMLQLARQIDDKDEALRLAESAWQAGDVNSLLLLSRIYERKFNSGEEPTARISAYAGLYAHAKITAAGLSIYGGDIPTRIAQRNKERLAAATKLLLPHEIDEAIMAANDLIKTNPNCCYRP